MRQKAKKNLNPGNPKPGAGAEMSFVKPFRTIPYGAVVFAVNHKSPGTGRFLP
jgi:hypothetical protein